MHTHISQITSLIENLWCLYSNSCYFSEGFHANILINREQLYVTVLEKCLQNLRFHLHISRLFAFLATNNIVIPLPLSYFQKLKFKSNKNLKHVIVALSSLFHLTLILHI